jgi:protein tyrosine phosphatase (PTP) superfamily phosphohydrolase (DUF442 family)
MTAKVLVSSVGAFALLLATASSARARQQAEDKNPPQHPPQHVPGTKLSGTGITNFGQVTPNLFRGAQPSAEGLQTLKNKGVEMVVDLRRGGISNEQAAVTKLGMQFVSIPSHCETPSDASWARFLQVMRENRGKKVFVHCELGIDRTGMAVAAYRMAEEGWTADEALREMKSFGFSSAHHALCPGLAEYEHGFPERLKNSPAFRDLQRQNADSHK